jgi:hypothetical protein
LVIVVITLQLLRTPGSATVGNETAVQCTAALQRFLRLALHALKCSFLRHCSATRRTGYRAGNEAAARHGKTHRGSCASRRPRHHALVALAAAALYTDVASRSRRRWRL